LKEALVDFTLRRRPLVTLVLVSRSIDDVILGLDGLRARDASLDVRRHVQGMGGEEILLYISRCDQALRPIRWVAANLFGVGDS
jgi:hypothetical protein